MTLPDIPFLQFSLWDRPLQDWLLAIALLLGGMALLRGALGIVRSRLADPQSTGARLGVRSVAGALVHSSRALLLGLPLILPASAVLAVSATVASWLGSLAVIAIVVQAGIWGNALLGAWAADYRRRHGEEMGGARVTTLNAMLFVARLILFSVVALLALDNIPGVNVTALVASLGIGGIAVALALQNILADLFASLTITLDKPFVIGDFIIVGEFLGVVEHVGLKTTRIRSLGGEQLVFANNDLLSSRIRNYGRMQERRVAFQFGVLYQTTADQLAAIPEQVRALMGELEQVRLDRVHFKNFGDSSLNFEVVYYVADPDYTLYMDKQEAINLALVRRLAAMGVGFAYPTRTIHLAGGTRLVTAPPPGAGDDQPGGHGPSDAPAGERGGEADGGPSPRPGGGARPTDAI